MVGRLPGEYLPPHPRDVAHSFRNFSRTVVAPAPCQRKRINRAMPPPALLYNDLLIIIHEPHYYSLRAAFVARRT